MSEIVIKDGFVSIGGTDLSVSVSSLTVSHSVETQESTAMGDNSRTYKAGMKNWTAEIEFNQNYQASGVDATIEALVGTDDVPLQFRHNSAAVSATNPQWSGNAIITAYNPIGGSVGEIVKATISLQGSGDLVRSTS